MDQREYDLLKDAIENECREKLAALEKLRPLLLNGIVAASVVAPVKKDKAARGNPLSDLERRAQKAAYMREWHRKNDGRKKRALSSGDNEDGIPKNQFKKFLHHGPISAGGTGEK